MLLVLLLALISVAPVSCLSLKDLLYDESYILNRLDDRFPYLKIPGNGTEVNYIGPRDYFNFSHVYQPSDEYLEKTNIESHLYDELRAMEIGSSIATMDQWHYSDSKTLLESGSPHANRKQCRRDLDLIEEKLMPRSTENGTEKSFDHLFLNGSQSVQLMRYIDSWGRPPSETYFGNSYWVGSHRGCLLSSLMRANDSSDRIDFHFCWGKLRPKSWPEDEELIPPINFRVGLCLPKSCDTRLARLNKHQVLRIMRFNMAPVHRERFTKLIDIYCLPNREKGLSREARWFIVAMKCWSFLIILTTILDSLDSVGARLPKSLLEVFSVRRNFQHFLSEDRPPILMVTPGTGYARRQAIDLRPLNLMRVFGSLGVITAHVNCALAWVQNSSRFSIIGIHWMLNRCTPLLFKTMDMFIVISGIVTGYKMLTSINRDKLSRLLSIPFIIISFAVRYLRLAPLSILLLVFVKSLYPFLSDGPMWDYGTYKFSLQGQCQRSSWWRTLLIPIMFGYQGDYYTNPCLPVTWYIVVDLKMALAAPIFLYLICRYRRRSLWIMGTVTIMSFISQYYAFSRQRLIYFQQYFTNSVFTAANMLNLKFGESSYYSFMNRFNAFSIGLFAGMYLLDYRDGIKISTGKETERFSWPWFMKGVAFKSMFAYQAYDLYSLYSAYKNYDQYGQLPSEEAIKLSTIIKPRIDAIMFAIMALRFTTDLAPKLMENTMVFYRLGKLGFGVFLVHGIVIAHILSSNEKSRGDAFPIEFFIVAIYVTVVSFLISFVLHLAFELPMAKLLTIWTRKLKSGSKSSKSKEDNRISDKNQD